MSVTPPLVNALFNLDEFHATAQKLMALLTENLCQSIEQSHRVMDWSSPQSSAKDWQQPLPMSSAMTSHDWLNFVHEKVLAKQLHIHHPRNMGHQVATPLPMTALCDLVAALTNQAMAIYETGPIATLIEQQVIGWLGELVGYGPQSSGVLTSGGAQANLTALLAARQVFFRQHQTNVWQTGLSNQLAPTILVNAHAHYSISRAAGIMGLGTEQIVTIPCNEYGELALDALTDTVAKLKQQHRPIMAIVACAGCTPTGSIDPITEIADLCERENIWLHVDGAHGASLLLSSERRTRLAGISRANSIVWDGHKLGYLPATVSAVLYRSTEDSFAAFAQEASYLFQGETLQDEFYNQSYRTLECTKRMMGFKWWTAFMLYGVTSLGALVDHVCQLAQSMANQIEQRPNFLLYIRPAINIVCFRLAMPQLTRDQQNQRHQQIRSQLVQTGQFHLTQTLLDGQIWLRTTLMNPFTTEHDIEALLMAVEQANHVIDAPLT